MTEMNKGVGVTINECSSTSENKPDKTLIFNKFKIVIVIQMFEWHPACLHLVSSLFSSRLPLCPIPQFSKTLSPITLALVWTCLSP